MSSKFTPAPFSPADLKPRDLDPPMVWAEYYVSLGWALSCFEPGTKGPTDRGWNTPSEWVDSVEKARAKWQRTPTFSMGIIHAGSGTVAIDIDHVDYTRHIFTEFGLDIDRLFAGAPRIRGAKSGRDKALFKAPDGAALATHKLQWKRGADVTSLFELRAGQVHDVLPPSMHPEGHRYEWRVAPWDIASMPVLPAELVAFWREIDTLRPQIAAMAPGAAPFEPPALHLPRAEGHNDVIGAFNRSYTVDALLRANGYVKKGRRYLAPSSATQIAGVVILESGKVYSHHGSDVLADGHAHDAFDLFRIFDHGGDFKRAVSAASDQLGVAVYGATAPGADFGELLQRATRAKKSAQPTEAPPFPKDLLGAAGLVGEFERYINTTARYPQPIFALAAAIAAAGCLMGRKVRTESDLRTNVYVLAVGEAGSGKEHPRQAIRSVFDHAGAFNRVTVEAIASDGSINTALLAVPSSLFLLDEIGRLLAVLNDVRASSHVSEITTQLLKLYGSANGPYCGKIYVDSDKNKIVQQPNLCIFGTTVPRKFHEALTTSQVEDGFLSRLMVFESDEPDPVPVSVGIQPPPQSLIDACAAWEKAPESYGDVGDVDAAVRPHPRVIAPDPRARLILDRFEAHMRDRRRALRDAKQPAALYVRTAANAQKLALILAAGRSADEPVITAADAEWACALATYLADSMAWRVLSHVAENQTERQVKRLGEVIRASGAGGITRSDLTRHTQGMTGGVRRDALETLVETGQVFAKAESGKTKSTQRYWWCAFAPDPEPDPNLSNTSNLSMVAA